jgi:hypothetical protein
MLSCVQSFLQAYIKSGCTSNAYRIPNYLITRKTLQSKLLNRLTLRNHIRCYRSTLDRAANWLSSQHIPCQGLTRENATSLNLASHSVNLSSLPSCQVCVSTWRVNLSRCVYSLLDRYSLLCCVKWAFPLCRARQGGGYIPPPLKILRLKNSEGITLPLNLYNFAKNFCCS